MVHGIIRLFARSRESTVKSKGIHGATVETWMPNSGCRFCCHLSAHILGIQSCRRMQMMSRHGGANRILRYELLEFNVGSRLASRVCSRNLNHKLDHLISTAVRFHPWTAVTGNQVSLWIKFLLQDHTRDAHAQQKTRFPCVPLGLGYPTSPNQ